MPVKDVSQFETRLRTRLLELNERLSDVEAELEQKADADVEERATEREGDEVLEGLGNAGLLEVRMIEAALGRIADGTRPIGKSSVVCASSASWKPSVI